MKARMSKGDHVSTAGRPILIVSPSSVVQSWERHLGIWGHFASASIVSGKRSIEVRKQVLRVCVCVCYSADLGHRRLRRSITGCN